jgi:type IV pilus assembly protein PilQ
MAPAQGQRDILSMVSNAPEEIVSLSGSLPFNQAMQMLSKLSKQYMNKIIVLSEEITEPIGIDIVSMNWYRALLLVLKYKNLEFTETAEYFKILPKKPIQPVIPDEIKGVDMSTREVSISAVFFELDVQKSRDVGINWKWLLSSKDDKLNIGGEMGKVDAALFDPAITGTTTGAAQQEKTFNLGVSAESNNVFGFFGKALAMFNIFEQNQWGEIIASPQISVRDRMKGEIQVGADFSTREKDFAGNTIERFYSTGTIIRVTPYVFEENGKNYILIDLNAERSTAVPGQISTEIKKTKASTNVLLIDGEETIIGGLYITEEKIERNGIPFLKDLPWWVLGIRYLTGSDSRLTTKKELIILLKAKLNPTLEERFAQKKQERNLIQERLEQNNREIKIHQMKPTDEK